MNLADRLREALGQAESEPPLSGDLPEIRTTVPIPAAVLIAITDRNEPGVILTVRRDTLRTHAGQIAFPGGRIDPGEEEVAAALREADEELGLGASLAEPIGRLSDYLTVTGYRVSPVIAVIPPDLPLIPHDAEVADWFEAPLRYVLDPANQKVQTAVFDGRKRSYWQIEWNGRQIWGATAAMLVNLSRRMQWT